MSGRGATTAPLVLDGRYEVGEVIAEGGMAQVRHGRDLKLKRDVAIKILRAQFAASPEFLDRFHREAELSARLAHPNLVSVFDVGQEGDLHFIVMELLPGRTLKDLTADGPLPAERAVELAREVALGMAFAHQRGLVHRDLKPQNVLLSESGHAKVADFGLALGSESTQLTQPGTVWGTVQYLSPEQAQGMPADSRSDVYSLGAILFELLTGRPPFDGGTPAAIMMKHVYDAPPDVHDVNPLVPMAAARVVRRALAKSRADRYESMDELARALGAVREAAAAETALWSVPRAPAGPRSAPAVPLPAGTPSVPTHDATKVLPASPRPGAGRRGRPRSRRLPLLLAASLLLFFALMALGATLTRQLLGVGAELPTPLPSTTRPAATATAVPPTPTPTVVMLAVPNVLGQPVATAQARLASAGLGSDTTEEFSPDVPRGSVVTQDPLANAQLEQGKTVKLVVSRGPQRVPVPNVVGMVTRDATAELTRGGFTVKRQDAYNSRPVETVFEQRPPAGEQVAPGSEITIVVSLGRDLVNVPALRGLTEEAARQELARLGLVATVQTVPDSSVQPGQVSTHSPAPNQQVDRGTAVIVLVARQSPTAAIAPPTTATAAPPAATSRPATPSATPGPRTNPGGQTPPGQAGGR